MKKYLLLLLGLITSVFSAEDYSFEFTLPFNVDDFEEVTTNLNIHTSISDTNLLYVSTPTISDNEWVTGFIPGELRNSVGLWRGVWLRTANNPIIVTELGRIFVNGNTNSHEISITSVNGLVKLASVVWTPVGGIHNKIKYVELSSPVILNPNTDYYLASFEVTGEDSWYSFDTTVSITDVATIINAIYLATTGNWIPVPGGEGKTYGPVNFKYIDSYPDPFEKFLSIKTFTNVFGSSLVTLTVSDNGVVSEYSDLLEVNTGIVSTNTYADSALNPTIIVNTNSVLLQWNAWTNGLVDGFPYKILRMSPEETNQPNTIGWTFGTNYVDDSIESNKQYYYMISFVPSIYTNYFSETSMSTNITFTVNVAPPIPLQFIGDGYVFQAYKNKNYGIFYKNNINDALWNRIGGVSIDADNLFMLRGKQYTDKIIYVKEE